MGDPGAARDNDVPPGKPMLVAVTGASGYIGSHVVKVLLERGHSVRGVVRDVSNTKKIDPLRAIADEVGGTLDLFSADLLDPGSHDEPFSGCDWVCHVAASVRLQAKDPQREIVDVAVHGTRNVLESANRASTVRRVVLTSSVAAVMSDDQPADHVFTEADWNRTARLSVDPYFLAKTLAERAAWAYHETLPADERFALVALNPAVVMGPLHTRAHNRSSPNTLRDLMRGKMPACPRLHMGLVDVRDVADAHARALENPEAHGRYLLQADGLWLRDMARTLKAHYPQYKIPTRQMPDLLLYAAALVDKRLSLRWLRRNVGRVIRVDTTRSRDELGVHYRPIDETLLDTADSFVRLGLV